MNILTLNLKKEYFEEILKGTKLEEYREVKDYWTKRLKKSYDKVVIKCGYPTSTDVQKEIWFDWDGFIKKSITHKHFDNRELEVYAISLNKRIENPKISKIKEYMEEDTLYFPNILEWFDSILYDENYAIRVYEDFYYIINKEKQEINRVEKFNHNDTSLETILSQIDKDFPNVDSVIVPKGKKGIVDKFLKLGFRIEKELKNYYQKGNSCYLMRRDYVK